MQDLQTSILQQSPAKYTSKQSPRNSGYSIVFVKLLIKVKHKSDEKISV